jgi:hypothetical protein
VELSCFEPFRVEPLLSQIVAERIAFSVMHKLDQDRALFDRLKSMALVQGVLVPGAAGSLVINSMLNYFVLGQPVGRKCFVALLGVGWYPRLSCIYEAVMNGAPSCPVDARYVKYGISTRPCILGSEVFSYIKTLYDSVAETLPETLLSDESVSSKSGQGVADADDYDTIELQQPSAPDVQLPMFGAASKFLPPGSITQEWKQFCAVHPGNSCSWWTFWSTWRTYFGLVLHFRGNFQHTVCSVCVKHRLLLTQLAHDSAASNKQRILYSRHLKSQYSDRQWYWDIRAQSRLRDRVICIIIDGMDQAKFSWPRHPVFGSHEFDSFHRPRLHIVAALVHGFFVEVFCSHADLRKTGSSTCEQLASIFTRLKNMGVDLASYTVHVQLDNTASSNKNNTVLWFCAALVGARVVKSIRLGFLRSGHSHEDIDQFFGELASWIIKNMRVAADLSDVESSIRAFLGSGNVRPYEAGRFVTRLDHLHDWKAWVNNFKRVMIGIAGAAAPHWFEFQCRGG